MKKISLLLILALVTINGFTQDQYLIDSLQIQLKNHYAAKLHLGKNVPAQYDTTGANILYELSFAYWGNDPDKAMFYAKQILELSEPIGFKKGMGNAFLCMGTIHAMKGDYSPALESLKKSLKIREEIGDKHGIATTNNSIGNIYWLQGNYPEALKNYFASLKISEKIGDKKAIGNYYNSIGTVYHAQGNYQEALMNYRAALKIKEGTGDKYSIATTFNNIGTLYADQGNYLEALKIHLKTLKIREEIGDKHGIAGSYDNIGTIYNKQGYYPEALKNFFLALKIQNEIGDKEGIAASCGFIGSIYIKQKKFSDAALYQNKELTLSREIQSLPRIEESYEGLVSSDSGQGNYKEAFRHYKCFIATRDSLMNNENIKKITQQQMQFDFDKREVLTKAEYEKTEALTKAEIQKNKIVRNFSFAGIIIVLLIGGYGFYRFRKQKKLESKQSLLDERLRISRDLHDEIGSTLGSISVYSEVAKNRAAKNENETEVLSKIGTASRELIDKMSDIVWSLNPQNETFEHLQNRMQSFAAMILPPHNITFDFSFDEQLKTTELTSEQRKNIFLIFKEAIYNVVKYAEATEVKVKVKVKEKLLTLVVIDNGKGFDISNIISYNGNGLKNMKARADEMKGELRINSSAGNGTIIELNLNV